MLKKLDRAWVEVNLDRVAHNFREVRRIVSENTLIMAVVKANAYGHGAVEVSRVLVENGADRLAVATIDEAIQLRGSNINVPLQVLCHTFSDRTEDIVRYGLIQTVYDAELARSISEEAKKRGVKARIHVKINTGMNRVGFAHTEESIESVIEIASLKGIELEGIMTHFASADEKDPVYTRLQYERFLEFCGKLDENDIGIPIRHVSNSAAILNHREMNLEMVRPGILLYGLHPSRDSKSSEVSLMPAMTLKARIISINSINENEYLSYGRTFQSKRKSRIATLAIGYADGYPRNLSNRARVLIHGEYAPVVGRICMDQCTADITDIAYDVKVGDEAVLFGQSGKEEVPADELVGLLDTVNYEIVSRLGARLPRVYTK